MRIRIIPVSWHPRYRFTIGGLKVNGKRRRLFFETAAEAKEELRRLNIKTERSGQAGLDISDLLRAQAADCAQRLKPYGKSIVDATNHFLGHLAASESPPIEELIERYIASKEREGHSAKHVHNTRIRLALFSTEFAGRPCRTLNTAEIESWLFGARSNVKPQTVNNWRSTVHAFFDWVVRQKLLDSNPADGVAVPKVIRKPPAIWKPEDLARLLHAAPPELVPMLAIGAFAGLRNAEALRLEWREVNFEAGLIEVPSAKSKTAQRRLVKIEPNLALWLAPYEANTGKIWTSWQQAYHDATAALCHKLGLTWPANGLRHSFASYHVAHFRNAAALALEMGHTGSHMLFQYYREVVTPADAARYWQIVP